MKSAAGYGFNISGPSPVFVTKVEEGEGEDCKSESIRVLMMCQTEVL